MSGLRALLALLLFAHDSGAGVRQVADESASDPTPRMIVGTDPTGVSHNRPAGWPAEAGRWNGKGASYNPATKRISFEVHRADIRGGSIPDSRTTAAGVNEYFVAGPGTGTSGVVGTSVLYVANADGTEPVCIGCTDMTDGRGGVTIWKVAPSLSGTPHRVMRQFGTTVYANQNKDLPTWHPSGAWLIAGVEMPRHALRHALGASEVGMFNDLWAISADGKTWVQLTDYASTWTYYDPIALIPYACAQTDRCPPGCQYGGDPSVGGMFPFGAYSCSAQGAPPPASGTMRPVMSNGLTGDLPGSAKLAWAERVGLSPKYTWGGVLQIAMADVVFSGGLPALAKYQRNITPTPNRPDGQNLWSNPAGNTLIGAGYEAWGFAEGDGHVTLASDVFLSTSDPSTTHAVAPWSQAFTDAIAWGWRPPFQTLINVTAYDPATYGYSDNAGPYPMKKFGHWEEPIVASRGADVPFFAFASSANLDPPWNPLNSRSTFGLETWVVRADRSRPARMLTRFNQRGSAGRTVAYPTAYDPNERALYLSVVRDFVPGGNPPGAIYRLRVPAL